MANIAFGSIDVTQDTNIETAGTLSVTCTGINNKTVIVCVGFGAGEGGISGSGSPRYMSSGSHTLSYEIYKDSGYANVWGSAWTGGAGSTNQLNITLNSTGSGSGSLTAYGIVYAAQQTVPPGSYSSIFDAPQVNFQYGYSGAGTCAGGFSYYTFPTFSVSATVITACSVTASTLNFGSTPSFITSNIDATATISALCSNTTPYSIGLNNGVNANGSQRRMQLGATGNYLSYNLYTNSGYSQAWSTTTSTTSCTAGVGSCDYGTGTGANQNYTVFGQVPAQSAPAVGNYTDTVVVTITF